MFTEPHLNTWKVEIILESYTNLLPALLVFR